MLTEAVGWGADYNIELTPIARRQEHQAGYIADVDAWLAGTKDAADLGLGRAAGPGHRLAGHRHPPRAARSTSPTPARCPDLPADAVVESICVVDGDGIRGRDVGPRCRPPYAELVRRHVAVQELTVEAAPRPATGALADAAFALDPLAGRGDLHQTEAMVDELLAGTAPWLPQFAR